MESRRKLNNDSPKYMFAGKLEALLARGKPPPILRKPTTASQFYQHENSTATSASTTVEQRELNLASSDNSSNSSTTKRGVSGKPSIGPPDVANRKLLIKEMLERSKSSRRFSIPLSNVTTSPHTNTDEMERETNGLVLQSTLVLVPPPLPPRSQPVEKGLPIPSTSFSNTLLDMASQPQLRSQTVQPPTPSAASTNQSLSDMVPAPPMRSQPVIPSTPSVSISNPSLSNMAPPKPLRSQPARLPTLSISLSNPSLTDVTNMNTNTETLSSSMPLLSPPDSPNLMDFQSSEDSDEDADPEQFQPRLPIVESAECIFTEFDDRIFTSTTNTITQEFLESENNVAVEQIEHEAFVESVDISIENSNNLAVANLFPESEVTSNLIVSVSNVSLDYCNQTNHVNNENVESTLNFSAQASGSIVPQESNEFNLSRASSSSSGISSVSYDSTPGGLRILDKIVWFTENGAPESGVVKWVGKINDRFHAGVQFENPVGNSSGNLKGKRLFSSPLTHGRFVPVSELMFHDDYYAGSSFNSEPSRFPNGFSDNKSDLYYGDSAPFLCVICQDDLLTRDEESTDKEGTKEMLTTRCGHLFHSDCLNKWFSLKNKLQQPCPFCQRLMNISGTIRIFPVVQERQ